jgi:hypothetical protein
MSAAHAPGSPVFIALLALFAALGLAACTGGESPAATTPVALRGEIRVPAGVRGPVHVVLYHAWSGTGVLRHPLQEIARFDATAGEYRQDFGYPAEEGEGLVVYAWVDVDGDGVLCTPQRRDDLAGLAVAQGFPAPAVRVDISLEAPCRAADWFFPAAAVPASRGGADGNDARPPAAGVGG